MTTTRITATGRKRRFSMKNASRFYLRINFSQGFIRGHRRNEGSGTCEETNRQCAITAAAGDQAYGQVADKIFKPFVESFKPQMIFISVGFDAHWNDPITSGLSTNGYFMLAQKCIALAEEFCNGRIVFVLEGGYDPANVAEAEVQLSTR
ncbi:MAG: hypothetical protein U0X87_17635 [Anaerolineales bacterium]